jgi:UDP-N-acetylmuramate--alanine ligase
MADLNKIRSIYFIGIGGIGMSALARYFRFRGLQVSGYDRTETVLTKELVAEGIPVGYEDELAALPKRVDLVVYTPAIPKDHRGLNYYREQGYEVLKRSEVLGLITESSLNVCVAGTHGKTTISTLIAHILRDTGYGCNAFLGGISVNYHTNFWSNERNVCVIEADEYDRSFLRLSPDIAVITSMDADHLDIYGTAGAVVRAFHDFAGKIKKEGTLISKYGLAMPPLGEGRRVHTYGLTQPDADIHAENIRIRNGSYWFDVKGKWISLETINLNIGGRHNIENTLAAIGVAKWFGLEDEKIKSAIADFRGVKRRFEYRVSPAAGKPEQPVYIDDYAHHPRELEALITGAKELFPDRKCIVIFQPHLFSRTRDFAEGFAQSLDLADEVILLPIYPARELPIEGVTSRQITDRMKLKDKTIMSARDLKQWVRDEKYKGPEPVLLITAGAGDIDQLVEPITGLLEKKAQGKE